MADADARVRKRDRLKARAKRYVDLPLKLRTADLPRRAASAVVMLAITGAAVWQGGPVLRGFIALVALACFVEFLRLIGRATIRPAARVAGAVGGAAYIGTAAWGLASFQPYHIVGVLGVVIFTDTCAYFAGRAIGGPKIAPRISPSKTWAGLAGGMVGSALWLEAYMAFAHNAGGSVRWAQEFGLGFDEALGWALVGAVLAITAQAGDFFESWLKRKAAVKDSSRLIPGHGGVFDRVDGILPVSLIVWLFAVLG